MTYYNNEIEKILLSGGASFAGFANAVYEDLPYGISYGVKLSDFVLSQIKDKPTYTYFSHYRTSNSLIDRLSILVGNYIESMGFRYMPVAASQTVNGHDTMAGEYSHKKVAFLSGLGYIGKNALFIHKDFGSKVRLGAVFTDMPLKTAKPLTEDICKDCRVCTNVCPAQAIYGKSFDINNPNENLIDRKACSDYMKREFMKIGRGSVCGICIKNCPHNKLR